MPDMRTLIGTDAGQVLSHRPLQHSADLVRRVALHVVGHVAVDVKSNIEKRRRDPV